MIKYLLLYKGHPFYSYIHSIQDYKYIDKYQASFHTSRIHSQSMDFDIHPRL